VIDSEVKAIHTAVKEASRRQPRTTHIFSNTRQQLLRARDVQQIARSAKHQTQQDLAECPGKAKIYSLVTGPRHQISWASAKLACICYRCKIAVNCDTPKAWENEPNYSLATTAFIAISPPHLFRCWFPPLLP